MIIKKQQSAFSLIELSIVLVVIGVLVAGISKGSTLIKQSKIKAAQMLTQNSPMYKLKGLSLWLDANDTETVVKSGSTKVSQWNDKSGNGRDAIQNTASNQPLLGDKDGLQCIAFDGIVNSTYQKHLIISDLTLDQNVNVFILAQNATQNNSGGSFYRGVFSSGLSSNGYNFGFKTSTDSGLSFIVPPTGNSIVLDEAPDQKFYIYNFVSDNGSMELFKNNTSIGTTTSDRTSNFASTYYVGAEIGNAARGYLGNICEIIIYNKALKSSDRQKIMDYLAKKWGLDLQS